MLMLTPFHTFYVNYNFINNGGWIFMYNHDYKIQVIYMYRIYNNLTNTGDILSGYI